MANFKVGQRVRIVRPDSKLNGLQGVIVGGLHLANLRSVSTGALRDGVMVYSVDVDGAPIPPGVWAIPHWGLEPHYLRPLTDGESDAWAADAVRKVTKPQHVEPVAPKRDLLPTNDPAIRWT